MENKNKLNSFLNSYHALMDYLRMEASYPNEYAIYITKHKKDEDHQILRVSIIRNVIEDRENSGPILDNKTILSNELIIPAINGIRDDFRDNHEISYAGISPDTKYQFLQNTNFKLSISIDSNEEYEEALKYNNAIMRNPNRTEETKKLVRTRENK